MLMKVTHFMITGLEHGERLAGSHTGAINGGLLPSSGMPKEARHQKTNIMAVGTHSRMPVILSIAVARRSELGPFNSLGTVAALSLRLTCKVFDNRE
jgi:hypothetical protein